MAPATSSRWAHVARGAFVAALSVFVAALSHLVAGGHTPGAVATTVAFVFGLLACTFALARRVSVPRVIVGVGISQGLFHLLFSMGSTGAEFSGTDHHSSVVVTLVTQPALHGAGGGMWIAHGLAGAVTVVALLVARNSWSGLATLPGPAFLRRILALDIVAPMPTPRVLVAREFPKPGELGLRDWLTAASHRGPPRAVAL